MEANVDKWRAEAQMGVSLPAPGSRVRAVGARRPKPSRAHPNKPAEESTEPRTSARRVEFRAACEQLHAAQRRDVTDLTSGRLSAAAVNKSFVPLTAQERRDRRARHPLNPVETPEAPIDGQSAIAAIISSVSLERAHDILSEFDPIKHPAAVLPPPPVQPAAKLSLRQGDDREAAAASHAAAQAIQNLTSGELVRKTDILRSMQTINACLIQPGLAHAKQASRAKADRLAQIRAWLDEQLAARNCPPAGPDFGRLQLYAACFERVIDEFRVYGPLLAEIKHEYDQLVHTFATDQSELDALRGKVQTLLGANDNRLLLKYEQQKIRQLEKQHAERLAANAALVDTLTGKIAIYASYLPASVYRERRASDPFLQQLHDRGAVPSFEPNQDPISVLAAQNAQARADIGALRAQLAQAVHERDHERIPRQRAEQLEVDLQSATDKLIFLQSQNHALEAGLRGKQAESDRLEAELRDKEDAYNFLLREYKDLCDRLEGTSGPSAASGPEP